MNLKAGGTFSCILTCHRACKCSSVQPAFFLSQPLFVTVLSCPCRQRLSLHNSSSSLSLPPETYPDPGSVCSVGSRGSTAWLGWISVLPQVAEVHKDFVVILPCEEVVRVVQGQQGRGEAAGLTRSLTSRPTLVVPDTAWPSGQWQTEGWQEGAFSHQRLLSSDW